MSTTKQVAIKVHAFGTYASWAPDGVHYHLGQESESPTGYVPLYAGQIIVELPDRATFIAAAVTRLREEQTKLCADTAKRVNDIEKTIQNMLAITYEAPAP